MGNNIVSSVIKVFDRSHLEIESISAKIDRDRINGCHEKHEVYVENIGIYQTKVNSMENNGRINQTQVHICRLCCFTESKVTVTHNSGNSIN